MSKLILLVDNVIINNNIDGIGSVGRSPDPHFLLYERKCLPSLSFVWWWIINIFLSLLFGTFPFYIYDNYMNVRIIDINVWPQIEWLRCLYMCLCLYMSVDIGKNVEKQSKAFFPFIRMVWMRWREIELQQHTQTPNESWPKKTRNTRKRQTYIQCGHHKTYESQSRMFGANRSQYTQT